MLAIDGLQPDVGHEVLWVLRDCLSGEVLLAKSLLSATAKDLAALLTEVREAPPVPITGVVSDGQESIRKAVAQTLPGVPHQLCHFHYLREAARPIDEADRHAKKELKKRVRGVRPIERAAEGEDDEEAEIVRGYCAAVRAALTDDGLPPLSAPGLKLHERLTQIAESLEWVADRLRRLAGGPRPAAAAVAAGAGGDGGVVAAGAGGLSLGPSRGPVAGEQGEAVGPGGAAAVGPAREADTPGGGHGRTPRVSSSTRPLREGDAELLAGTVLVLRVGGRAADQQRPGTPVRQPSLSRASGERSPAGVAGAGGAGFGAGGVGAGDAAATRTRACVFRRATWNAGGGLRGQLERRREARRRQGRFRRDPDRYLNELEQRCLQLCLPS